MAGIESVAPFLAFGGLGIALFFVLRSVRFVDARTREALKSSTARNEGLERQLQSAEAEADRERLERIEAQKRAGIAEARVESLNQRVEDLTAEVARLRAEIEELRQEMHGDAT